MDELRIVDITKKFPGVVALNNVNLEVSGGELFTLLGPSGCGKTTLLRTIAGFCKADSGHIYSGGEKIDDIPVFKRDIGMVFQNYAVFPHMTIFDNIAYGLKPRKTPKHEIQKRVLDALELVRLTELGSRRPSQLSGGQQQRVALARSIIINPRLLLMDEPLSNLDAKLRVEMRAEIKKLQADLHITTVYVTHDQEEALAISDRIAVFNAGIVMQTGAPWELYQKPANPFVANFLGRVNFLKADVSADGTVIINKEEILKLPEGPDRQNQKLTLAVRPEDISIRAERENIEGLWLEGHIREITFLGPVIHLNVEISEGDLEITTFKNTLEAGFSLDDKVYVYTPVKDIKIFSL